MTIQYQGVWSLQSAAQLQSTQRWVTDPLYKNTTLLLQADDAANGAQNNTFLDSSSNSFAITRNGGNPGMTQGSFTPFSSQPGAWGNYLDASSTLSYTQPALGSVFTLEFWTWPSSIVSGALLYVASSNAPLIGYAGGILSVGQQGAWLITSSTNPTPNQWNHIAVVREGTGSNQLKLYLNGVLTGTGTSATTITSQSATIGGSGLVAYISNLRVVDGTAIYTSNFTPPIAPFTAIAGTVLLTCQSNRFIDANTQVAAKTITTSGTPSVQAFSPFAPQYQWTSSVIGGSGYFDGTGDFLSYATGGSAAFNLSTGDWTIEAWIYRNASGAGHQIINLFNSAGANSGLSFYVNSSNQLAQDNGVTATTAAGTVPANAWTHVAAVRSAGNTQLYVNGVAVGSAITQTPNTAQFFRIGITANDILPCNGYISGLRIIKGQALNSSGNFTPPTSPVTTTSVGWTGANVASSITGTVSLLTNFTNAAIFDGTMKNVLETVGNAQISTAVVKYGSGSMFFDGTDDRLFIPTASQNQAMGTGDWTVEFWFYSTITTFSNWRIMLDFRPTNTNGAYITCSINASAQPVFYTQSAERIIGNAIVSNQWYHFAVCKANNSTRMFINGVQNGSTYSDTNSYLDSGRILVASGGFSPGTEMFIGYIDDLRITRGVARYTANFIPPSVALPRQ